MLSQKALKTIVIGSLVYLTATNLLAGKVIQDQEKKYKRLHKHATIVNSIAIDLAERIDPDVCDEIYKKHEFDMITFSLDL